jgi:internalin A
LQGNQIRALPESIGNLTSLKHLNLNRNQLDSMPPVISNPCLISLNLCNNRLRSLPRLVTPQLRFLTASNNRLRAMPEDVSSLTQLDMLQLEANQLRHFPEHYAQLTSVTLLDVRQNSIVRLAIRFHETAPPFVCVL